MDDYSDVEETIYNRLVFALREIVQRADSLGEARRLAYKALTDGPYPVGLDE